MTFGAELARGRLTAPWCPRCGAHAWPPSGACGRCLGPAELRPFPESGAVVGLSSDDAGAFCLADFGGGIRIAGRLPPGAGARVGMRVRVAAAGTRGGRPFYDLEPAGK